MRPAISGRSGASSAKSCRTSSDGTCSPTPTLDVRSITGSILPTPCRTPRCPPTRRSKASGERLRRSYRLPAGPVPRGRRLPARGRDRSDEESPTRALRLHTILPLRGRAAPGQPLLPIFAIKAAASTRDAMRIPLRRPRRAPTPALLWASLPRRESQERGGEFGTARRGRSEERTLSCGGERIRALIELAGGGL